MVVVQHTRVWTLSCSDKCRKTLGKIVQGNSETCDECHAQKSLVQDGCFLFVDGQRSAHLDGRHVRDAAITLKHMQVILRSVGWIGAWVIPALWWNNEVGFVSPLTAINDSLLKWLGGPVIVGWSNWRGARGWWCYGRQRDGDVRNSVAMAVTMAVAVGVIVDILLVKHINFFFTLIVEQVNDVVKYPPERRIERDCKTSGMEPCE